MFVMLINLRGVKESGAAIAIPSFFFIVIMFITVGVGMVKYFTGSLGAVIDPPELVEVHGALAAVTPFLILHAFSSGTAALTGIEAISNGITAFKEPRSKNAGITSGLDGFHSGLACFWEFPFLQFKLVLCLLNLKRSFLK